MINLVSFSIYFVDFVFPTLISNTVMLSQSMMMDGFLAFGSLIFVFAWIWAGTGSSFLAVCGMLEIIISLPAALVVWVIAGQV